MVLVQGSGARSRTRGGAEVDVHVRPERVYVWPGRRPRGRARALRRARRRGPLGPQRGARGRPRAARGRRRRGTSAWTRSAPATRRPSWPSSGPDGLPVRRPRPGPRRPRGGPRAASTPTRSGAPIEPGLACLCADAPDGAASTCSATSTRIAASGSCAPPRRRRPHTPRAATGADGGPHRRGHRSDGRDRPRLRPLAGALARGRAHRRHGAPALRPRRPRLEAHRVPPRRRARPRLGRGARRGRRRRRAPGLRRRQGQQRDPPRQRRGLAQRLRGRGRRRRAAAGLLELGRRVRVPRGPRRPASPRTSRRSATRATRTPPTRPRSRTSSTRR